MRYDRYYCYAISQQKQDALNFGEIDLLLRKLQKPQWSGPMASCPPERAGPTYGRTGAGRRMQAGPGASGPACESSARECEARLGGRHGQRAAWEKIAQPV